MRMLIAGGGTGGHLFPAVALAQKLTEQEPQSDICFVGTDRGIEAKVIPELGWPLEKIEISGFAGTGIAAKLALVPKLGRSIVDSIRIIKHFRPDIVVGVGGYASGPVLFAARLQGIPSLIHEQNALPGLTNRLLARWVNKVCISFEESLHRFKGGKLLFTGNPLRKGMDQCPEISGKPVLLVFGGSRGARAINDAMMDALNHLGQHWPDLKIIHQTGEEDLERVRAEYTRANWKDAEITPFISDMAGAYAQAHLVVCRAGATSVAELVACGRPSIMVPFPQAAADHQTINALAIEKKGAGFLLPQAEMNGEKLPHLIDTLLNDPERLRMMGAVARSMYSDGAADRILAACRELIGTRGGVK